MSAYVGQTRRFKDALVNLLTGLTYDAGSGSEPIFVNVLDSNFMRFNGTPTAQVLPGNEAISRVSAHQQQKVPTLIVRVAIDMEDAELSKQAAFNRMYDISDIVIDAIGTAENSSLLDDSRGPMGTYFADAATGDWLEAPTSGGVQLLFDINVNITYSRNL